MFQTKTNLLKLKNAFVKQMKSKAGMIDVLIIPIEMNQLFKSDKGVYLEQSGFPITNPQPNSKDTHLMKQSFNKEVYNAMTDEQKKALPILGNAIVWNSAPPSTPSVQQPAANNVGSYQPDEDDLPF